MGRDNGSPGLISTRNLAAAAVVAASGGVFAAPSAQARVYWKACAPPKVNEAGSASYHPRSTSGWNWGWADTGCSATAAGIPCVGFNPPSQYDYACPSYSTRTYSVREYFLVQYRAFFRLCGQCIGRNYTNKHYTEGSSY
jgi:hypothetical protein